MGLLSKIASAVGDLIVRLRDPVEPEPEDLMEWRKQVRERWRAADLARLDTKIARLRRNKKRHLHLVAQRDALMREAAQ